MSVTFKGADFSAPINFVGMYSDGTQFVKTEQFQEIADKADTMILRADSMLEFVLGMFLVDAIEDAGGIISYLVLPYVPGARQDRSNPTGDVLVTARSVAHMINERDFSKVTILDPHSPVITGYINDVVEYPLERVAKQFKGKYVGVIAPDKGAKSRAFRFASVLNVPIFYGSKVRDVSTGKLEGFDLEDLYRDGHYLVVDDICDGGGTFIGLGEKIVEQGQTADLYVSHGIFSKGTRALKEVYNDIYTTDSRTLHIEGRRTEVNTIKVVEEMENYND